MILVTHVTNGRYEIFSFLDSQPEITIFVLEIFNLLVFDVQISEKFRNFVIEFFYLLVQGFNFHSVKSMSSSRGPPTAMCTEILTTNDDAS